MREVDFGLTVCNSIPLPLHPTVSDPGTRTFTKSPRWNPLWINNQSYLNPSLSIPNLEHQVHLTLLAKSATTRPWIEANAPRLEVSITRLKSIQDCTKSKRLKEAESIFVRMIVSQIQPDIITYSTRMSGYAKLDDVNKCGILKKKSNQEISHLLMMCEERRE